MYLNKKITCKKVRYLESKLQKESVLECKLPQIKIASKCEQDEQIEQLCLHGPKLVHDYFLY